MDELDTYGALILQSIDSGIIECRINKLNCVADIHI